MVYIPPGSFEMGVRSIENASPAHRVIISRGFYMGKYPVTQDQWVAIAGSNPSGFTNDGGSNPVENVFWIDCRKFIEKLNSLGKYDGRFDLPTEAEWGYACRAGSTTRYYWGDEMFFDFIITHFRAKWK